MIFSEEIRSAAIRYGDDSATDLADALRAVFGCGGNEEVAVFWRVKTIQSIVAKQKRRPEDAVLNDFIGFRAVVLHIGLVAEAVNVVRGWANKRGLLLVEEEDHFARPGLGRYRAVHMDFRLLTPETVGLTSACGVEVQITTYLQNVHSLISHAVLYKQGAVAKRSPPIEPMIAELSEKLERIDAMIAAFWKHHWP
jgi:ppGpp synthetase/RelA/SpoT-type nucleotidyltranferase